AAVFDTIAETGRGAIASLREVVAALRTVGMGMVEDLVARTDKAILVVDGQPRPVSSEVDETVYRLVQEALTNVSRHAEASKVLVRLRWRERHLEVQVVDNGRGPTGKPGGYGLIGMRERVAACGGTIQTGPTPTGPGFAVQATLPIH
ncbi:sensor histidine kinase, partial [Kibdelosporangium lantanae]